MKDFIIAFHYCLPEVHTTNWERNEFPQRCQPWVTSFVPDKDIPQSLYLFSFFFRRSGGALLQTYSWQVTQWQRMYLDFTGLARKCIYSYLQFWCIVYSCSWGIQSNLFVLTHEFSANNNIHLQCFLLSPSRKCSTITVNNSVLLTFRDLCECVDKFTTLFWFHVFIFIRCWADVRVSSR